jgi:hypothetical protein
MVWHGVDVRNIPYPVKVNSLQIDREILDRYPEGLGKFGADGARVLFDKAALQVNMPQPERRQCG